MKDRWIWTLIAVLGLAMALFLAGMQGAFATDLNGQWNNSPNSAWYKQQVPTAQTKKIYNLDWESCCDTGDVCQDCVVHKFSNRPPWADGFYYEQNGVLHRLPDHIVEYVPRTPTGKPVLFIAPFDAGKIHKGDPVCLKVPGGDT